MGLERNQRVIGDRLQHQSERTLFISPDTDGQITKMTPSNKAVIVNIASAISHTVMLPPVSECAGEFYSVRVPDAGSGCTVVAYGDGSSLDDAVDWTDLVLDADNDNCLLYSDGYKWFVVVLDENV